MKKLLKHDNNAIMSFKWKWIISKWFSSSLILVIATNHYSYPRDALHSAVFAVATRPSVRLSVCLSHAGIVSKWLNVFRPPDNPIFLVFDPLRRCSIPRGILQWGRKIHGVGKFAISDWNRRLTRKRCELRPMVTMERLLIGNRRWRIDTCRFRWPWVTPNPGFKVTVYLQVKCLKNGAS